MTSIRQDKLNPVYILMGEEAYFIDLLVSAFEKNIIAEEDRDFNLNVFYGNDADVDYVIGAARQFPVMADRKLVILKEAQTMNQAKAQLDRFAPYVANPSPGTVFVIAYKGEPLTAGSKLVKAAKSAGGVVFASNVPYDNELQRHIRDYCQERRFSIDDKSVELLAEYIGLPLSKLFGEVNKLMSIKGSADSRITTDDIEKNIGISKDYNNLELTKALARKDYPKTMKIIRHFKASPKYNPTPVTTAMMLKFFSNLVIAHYMADKTDRALYDEFGLKSSYQLDDLKSALRNYTAMQSVNAIHYLREFDTKSKGIGSLGNEYDLLAEIIFKIFT